MANEKTQQCKKVLQLIDEDYTYTEALNFVLAEYPNTDKEKLEIELETYI